MVVSKFIKLLFYWWSSKTYPFFPLLWTVHLSKSFYKRHRRQIRGHRYVYINGYHKKKKPSNLYAHTNSCQHRLLSIAHNFVNLLGEKFHVVVVLVNVSLITNEVMVLITSYILHWWGSDLLSKIGWDRWHLTLGRGDSQQVIIHICLWSWGERHQIPHRSTWSCTWEQSE